MMEWGLDCKLSGDERRSMRLVCRELRQAIDAQVHGTLVLHLVNDTCSNTATATAIAQFHRSRPSAKQLHVYIKYSSAEMGAATSSFMTTYANAVAGGQATVTRCRVTTAKGCRLHLSTFISLLRVLPALECLSGCTSQQAYRRCCFPNA